MVIVDLKKISLVLVMVCILLLAFPSPVKGMFNPDDFTYSVSDGSASITGYTGTGTLIYIPPLLGGYIVETIDSEALSNKGLWEIYIPASVISIGENAFAGNQDVLRLVGEAGSAAETYALENGHAFEEKRWTVEKTASHETVSLGTGESATILYTIEATVHSVVDTTSTYDQHLIWNGVVYPWGLPALLEWDANEDDGMATMSIEGFEIQRPFSSISRLSRGRDESRTDSYELTITNVDAEAGKTFRLGNYAFVVNSDGFPYDWTANLITVTTPDGDMPDETPDPGEETEEEEEEEEQEEQEQEQEQEQELPQTGGTAHYGLGLLLIAGALTLLKNRKNNSK